MLAGLILKRSPQGGGGGVVMVMVVVVVSVILDFRKMVLNNFLFHNGI